jgi:hypothetical protein
LDWEDMSGKMRMLPPINSLRDLLEFEEMEILENRVVNLYNVTLLLTFDENIELRSGYKFPIVAFDINHASLAFYNITKNGTIRFLIEKTLNVELGRHIQ